jgi:hypothetical protein
VAAYSEIVIEQYSDFSTTVTLDDIQGDSLNLTNYTASSQIRKSYYSTTATNFTVSISNAIEGELTLSLSSANTANLSPGRYVYDVVIVSPSPSNTKTRVVEGIVTVIPGVTR